MTSTPLSRRLFLQLGLGSAAALGLQSPGRVWAHMATSDVHGQSLTAMGTLVTLVARHADAGLAKSALRQAAAEILAVHDKMTIFAPSPLRNLSQRAQQSLASVDDTQLEAVLSAAFSLSKDSAGSFAPLYSQGPQKFNASAIDWDPKRGTLRLIRPSLALDFNAIAKGYAVDQAAMTLRARGLEHFIVNAGGDLYAAGDAESNKPGWPIQIHAGDLRQSLKTLWLRDQAAATSGNLGRGPLAELQAQVHLRDPRHGSPAEAFLACTVVAPQAMQADALATTLFVGGAKQGRALLNARPKTHAWLVHHDRHLQEIG